MAIQPSLCQTWSETPKAFFSHNEAHLIISGFVCRETDDSLLLAYPGPCNVEIRDGTLTQQEFLDKYVYHINSRRDITCVFDDI